MSSEDPGRFAALGVANDRPAVGILRRARDAGERQSPRIGQRHVTVEAGDEDRVVAGGRIDPLSRRQRRAWPALVVPSDVGDPPPGRCLSCVLGELGDEFVAARGEAQVGAEQALAASEEVGVAVDEPRQEALAAGVEDAGRWTDERRDLGVGADGNQALAAHREGGGLSDGAPGRAFYSSPDPGVTDDQVGRGFGRPGDGED